MKPCSTLNTAINGNIKVDVYTLPRIEKKWVCARCSVSKVHSDNASGLNGRFVNENVFDVLDLQGKGAK